MKHQANVVVKTAAIAKAEVRERESEILKDVTRDFFLSMFSRSLFENLRVQKLLEGFSDSEGGFGQRLDKVAGFRLLEVPVIYSTDNEIVGMEYGYSAKIMYRPREDKKDAPQFSTEGSHHSIDIGLFVVKPFTELSKLLKSKKIEVEAPLASIKKQKILSSDSDSAKNLLIFSDETAKRATVHAGDILGLMVSPLMGVEKHPDDEKAFDSFYRVGIRP